jgi:energy-coupling factor transporter ATP-binding protein EcfA2/fructose-specific component phosphotransferase system IIB-like protein
LDPNKLSLEYSRKAKRANDLADGLKLVIARLSDSAVKQHQKLVTDTIAAADAVLVASKAIADDSTLNGVGSSTWRSLYEAAKAYAIREAYPNEEYADTFTKRCVLCQQPLAPDATERMRKFQRFVQDKASQRLDQLGKDVTKALASLRELKLDLLPSASEIEAELSDEAPDLRSAVTKVLADAATTREAITTALERRTWPEGINALTDQETIQLLTNRSKQLEARAEAVTKEKPTAEQQQEERDLAELEHRILLGKHIESIKKYVRGLAQKSILEKCRHDVDSGVVTKKQTALLNQQITEPLHNALTTELKALGVHHIVPKFVPSGQKGKLAHTIVLEGLTASKCSLAEVLSEGEELVIAVAAFLAELSLAEKFCVVVFDDPVSSLDHKWRANVAKRLAALSGKRQVIVLTHDLVFVFSLIDSMKTLKREGECTVIAIEATAKHSGVLVPEGGEPLELLTVQKRLKRLNVRVQEARTVWNAEGEGEKYREHVQGTYTLLRKTWERAIEQVLFGNVVQRFRDSVETNRLKDVATVITDDDCTLIRNAYGKASEKEHDTPLAAKGSSPTPDELAADVEELKKFVDDIERRQELKRKAPALAAASEER